MQNTVVMLARLENAKGRILTGDTWMETLDESSVLSLGSDDSVLVLESRICIKCALDMFAPIFA